MLPTSKAKFVFDFGESAILRSETTKLFLLTPSGLISGRPARSQDTHDNVSVKIHCTLMKDIKGEQSVTEPFEKSDGCIILEDVDVSPAPNKTFHFDALTVFLDQVVAVSLGETKTYRN